MRTLIQQEEEERRWNEEGEVGERLDPGQGFRKGEALSFGEVLRGWRREQ